MIDGSEVVTANTEQVLNRTMDGKEKLDKTFAAVLKGRSKIKSKIGSR